jgi:hypothetical protein
VLRRLVAAATVLFLAVALGACGDDGAGDDESGTPSPSGNERMQTSGGEPDGPAPEGIDGVIAFTIPSRNHTEAPLEYDHLPPAGGDHFRVPATCGFYSSADPPPLELIVHSLEHGAVWVAYRPDLDAAQVETLRQLAAQETKFIATPFEGMDSPLTVTAWARQLPLDTVEDPRLRQFIDTYRNGPETPEPAAPCQGAGEPEVPAPSA